jgi:hypothetical protein
MPFAIVKINPQRRNIHVLNWGNHKVKNAVCKNFKQKVLYFIFLSNKCFHLFKLFSKFTADLQSYNYKISDKCGQIQECGL